MLRVALKVLAVGIALAGASHVLMGPTADLMLGVKLPASTVIEPSLDSQNRFYGAIFTLYAALLWLAANDLPRYRIVLRLVLAWFFIGALMRLVSLALRGWPSEMILLLTLLELVVPPLLWWAAPARGTVDARAMAGLNASVGAPYRPTAYGPPRTRAR